MWIMTERGWRPLHAPCVNSNCVEGTFIDRSPEEVRAMISNDPYWQVWDDYRHGVIGWNEWLNHEVHKREPYSPIVKHSRLRSLGGM